MGVGRYLRPVKPAVHVHPLEPAESPTLRTGSRCGQHRIQGISDEFIPAIVKLDQLDAIVDAADGDAILMAQKLAQVGLAVGISSGANLVGAIKVQDDLSPIVLKPAKGRFPVSTSLPGHSPICGWLRSPG